MKKCIVLLSFFVTLSCDRNIKSNPSENTELSEFQKQSDIYSVKNLISNSFQSIFSDLDSTAVLKYYTNDFMLLENGVIWNNDSINSYIRKSQVNKQNYQRLNRFDFVKSVYNQNTIWIAYENYATFVNEKDTLGTAHWLESVIAKKEKGKWKLQQLHSTIVGH